MMSNGAWAVLKQLKRGGVWDGDLIDKAGRTELMRKIYRMGRVGHSTPRTRSADDH